uniref:Leukotriene C4 synthase n=1 Tax=Gallus gallus TaxID=9031 RepID=A0A8V0YZA7_CHICK
TKIALHVAARKALIVPTCSSTLSSLDVLSSCRRNRKEQKGSTSASYVRKHFCVPVIFGTSRSHCAPQLKAYFFLQVIHARRKFGISPPNISGPPEFERIFRAQVNSSEYFPIFVALLWQAGLFFHQGLAAALGLLYLYSRYCYFMGYRASSSDRLTPIYFSTGVLWVLIAAATLGLLHFFLSHYVGLNVLRLIAA